jgi:hypothetical protein
MVVDNSWKIFELRHMFSTVLTCSVKQSGVKSWCILEGFLIILEVIVNSRRYMVKAQSHCPECNPEWPRLSPSRLIRNLEKGIGFTHDIVMYTVGLQYGVETDSVRIATIWYDLCRYHYGVVTNRSELFRCAMVYHDCSTTFHDFWISPDGCSRWPQECLKMGINRLDSRLL